MTNATKQPIWGDENGLVPSYMCQIDFDHELGVGNAPCTKLYPSEEALLEAHPCAYDCGVVKVAVRAMDEMPDEEQPEKARFGWMEHIEFYCELGGAKKGNGVYSSERAVRDARPYAKTYGVVPVEVALVEVVREPTNEYLRPREKPMGVNPHLMAAHLAHDTAAMIHEWQETFNNPSVEAPDECQPAYLLDLLQKVEKLGHEAECCATKLHRLLGYIHGVMVALNICGAERIRHMVQDAKKHYAEEEDVDLIAHHDKTSPFFLDIGGEG